ncbi:MAG: ribosome small subunit-dependent GTPase A [Candidatus Gastranaerophilales bacterium]|nr:ribosome small subunit-dependent GTPase A [Candidatus Gastranaerophilales bacterium]
MAKTGQVYKIHSDFYYVNSDNEVYECKVREVLKKQDRKIYVGDFVDFENGYITQILERKNFIPRPAVANINQVVIVSAVREPELDFHQLDRYIAFAEYYGLEIKLCFNKNDLSSDDSLIEKVFSIYEPLGYDIVFTSALEGLELDDFEEIMKGKISVLCGQSGVGKSSLINSLNPEFDLRTKKVSEKTSRGTHTTRHCEIMTISDDIKIIDTPGFSNLKFDFLLPHDVDKLFKEFKDYQNICKYQDCLHIHEDGCKILEDIESFAPSRYESYLEFVKEAKEYKEKIKYQGNKTESRFKQTHNKMTVKISANKRQASRRTLKQDLYKEFEDE